MIAACIPARFPRIQLGISMVFVFSRVSMCYSSCLCVQEKPDKLTDQRRRVQGIYALA